MRKSHGLYLLAVLALAGCTTTLRGDPVDLHTIAQPEPEPQPPPPVVPLLPALTTEQAWRIWVPRQAAQDGSTSEGHWVELPRNGPQLQLTEPRLTIPRAPKAGFQKPRPPQKTGASAPASPPTPGLPAPADADAGSGLSLPGLPGQPGGLR